MSGFSKFSLLLIHKQQLKKVEHKYNQIMKTIKILYIENATHNVMHIQTEKPENFIYNSGQAADISVNKPQWKDEIRPFTFTSLPQDNHLEFFIKVYPEHKGVTEQIGKLHKGDSLNIGDVFGEIAYKGEGIFIAGGAGITPFIAIFKKLQSERKVGNNKLIFANKTQADIVEKEYFSNLLKENFVNVLSDEKTDDFEYGYITKEIIQKLNIEDSTRFYVCGPPPMMDAVLKELSDLKVAQDKIINESY